MRLGLHALTRELPQAADWCWIVDHTVQIGHQKCFVIVAVRLGELEWFCPQTSELEVVAIEPVEQSNADIVKEQLTAATKRTGVPQQIVSDACPELKRGIRQFQEAHSQTRAVSDIKHKSALLLKKSLEKDDRWKAFLKELEQARQTVSRGTLAHLTPPPMKSKARYMNLEPLIRWCNQMLEYLAAPFSYSADTPLEVGPINIYFKWLQNFREDIEEWTRQIEILETTTDHCRRHGYYRGVAPALRPRLQAIAEGERSSKVANAMLDFLEEQCSHLEDGERLLATSEPIESLFSMLKHLEKQQALSGFTSMILGLAASVVPPTQKVISLAFSAVKTRDVLQWAQKKLGMSVQAKRQRTLGKLGGTKVA